MRERGRVRRHPRHQSHRRDAPPRAPRAARRHVQGRRRVPGRGGGRAWCVSSRRRRVRPGLDDYRVLVNVGEGAGRPCSISTGTCSAAAPMRRGSPRAHWRRTLVSLIARIEAELKSARLARDEDRRDALSLVLHALQGRRRNCSARCPTTRSCRCSSASASDVSRRRRRSAPAVARSRPRTRSTSSRSSRSSCPNRCGGGDRGDHRRRHLRGRRDEHPRHGTRDGRRDAPGLRTRRRLRRLAARQGKARLTPPTCERRPRREAPTPLHCA